MDGKEAARVNEADALAREVAQSVSHLHGPENVSYKMDELLVVCLVRNGRHYVEPFMDHYRRLGVRHVVFLDNGSDDGTVEALKGYKDVTVLQTPLPYKDYKYAMKQYLMRCFGDGRWCLYVDIDELFDYPRSDVVSLRRLLSYLSERGYTAVLAHMLDMFPEEPVGGRGPEDRDPREAHRFYDISQVQRTWYTYSWRMAENVAGSEDLKVFHGGIRRAVFDLGVNLSKHPLVFMDEKVRPMDNSSHRTNNAYVADVSCVLYHYKFLDNFRELTERAIQEGSYFDGSAEYRRYKEVLEETPELYLKRETSRELVGVDDLVSGGFLTVSEDYAGLADILEEGLLEKLAKEDSSSLVERYKKLRSEVNLAQEHIREQNEMLRLGEKQLWDQMAQLDGPGRGRMRRLEERNQAFESQIHEIKSSRLWKAMMVMGRLKRRLLGLFRR